VQRGLRLVRVSAARRDELLANTDKPDTVWRSERDGTDIVLGGIIGLDVETSGFLELRATGAGLVSGTFDDPNRGRSADDRARAIWPLDPGSGPREPSKIYGFAVDKDGKVSVPEEHAVLVRFDNIDGQRGPSFGLVDFDVYANQRSRDRARRVSYPFKPADTKARVLTMEAIAGSRTAQYIRYADGRALKSEDQTARSGKLRIALPSTCRPARPDTLTILPAFALEHGGRLTRKYSSPWRESASNAGLQRSLPPM
jgi:hypothetical protein